MKTVICDDELPALDLICSMLKETGKVEVVAACQSALEAIDIINRGGIDLAFFDVEMPELSGVVAASKISVEPKPLLVFATAHPEYAVDAFGIDAIDYVLKPLDQDRITKSVEKARRLSRMIRERSVSSLQGAEMSEKSSTDEVLRIKDGGSIHFIPLRDISWIEAAGDYSLLHRPNAEVAVRRTISSLEADLPQTRFVRVHRSSIVSIPHIREVKLLAKGEAVIKLIDSTLVRASRSYRKVVAEFAS